MIMILLLFLSLPASSSGVKSSFYFFAVVGNQNRVISKSNPSFSLSKKIVNDGLNVLLSPPASPSSSSSSSSSSLFCVFCCTNTGAYRGKPAALSLPNLSPPSSDQISQHQSNFKKGGDIPPLVIGFSAPQGCGKTTLVFALHYLFQITGRRTATLSINDFYLTADGQAKLREQLGNLLLELRGNAGSHDLPFYVETLTAVTKLTKEGEPSYNGRDDRADPSVWPPVEGSLTSVLFGFRPLPVEVVKAVDTQAEIAIAGKPGKSDEDGEDFVSRYLPAYKAYLPTLYSEGPNGSIPKHLLVIEIDERRNPRLGN